MNDTYARLDANTEIAIDIDGAEGVRGNILYTVEIPGDATLVAVDSIGDVIHVVVYDDWREGMSDSDVISYALAQQALRSRWALASDNSLVALETFRVYTDEADMAVYDDAEGYDENPLPGVGIPTDPDELSPAHELRLVRAANSRNPHSKRIAQVLREYVTHMDEVIEVLSEQ